MLGRELCLCASVYRAHRFLKMTFAQPAASGPLTRARSVMQCRTPQQKPTKRAQSIGSFASGPAAGVSKHLTLSRQSEITQVRPRIAARGVKCSSVDRVSLMLSLSPVECRRSACKSRVLSLRDSHGWVAGQGDRQDPADPWRGGWQHRCRL